MHARSVLVKGLRSRYVCSMFFDVLFLIRHRVATKVTEAIHKTRWIIATRAGGIPLQIRDGIDGRLVNPADPHGISEALKEFYARGEDEKDTGEMKGNEVQKPLGGRWSDDETNGHAPQGPREELFTIGNATMWHVSGKSWAWLWLNTDFFAVSMVRNLGNQRQRAGGPSGRTQ